MHIMYTPHYLCSTFSEPHKLRCLAHHCFSNPIELMNRDRGAKQWFSSVAACPLRLRSSYISIGC